MARAGQRLSTIVTLLIALLIALPASAEEGAGPDNRAGDVRPLSAIARLDVPRLDLARVALEDEERAFQGLAPRYAIPNPVSIVPATHGTWEQLDEGTRLWRLRVSSPGALSLNLGFTRYALPPAASLVVRSADGGETLGPFTAADNEEHGELWTPVLPTDDVVVELRVPVKAVDELDLEIGSINVGYRGFGEMLDGRSGSCNVDVVCPEGDDWRDDIKSVAVISTGGSLFCTGFMVNNTAEDETPYFMTANHCGIDAGNAASLVVYWNFESPTCGQHGGGSLSDYQTGSYFRAGCSTSDFTLVELDELPDAGFGVTYAGWDRTSADATSAIAIHHPSCDEKSISFEYDATTTTSYLSQSVPGDGSHIRVIDWDLGTTEPGSSGSPLFNQDHRVVGQLHGGYAACGNDESDWYGRFSISWTGSGTSSTRLSNWLDPIGTGATTLDLLAPGASGMRVTPLSGLSSSGPSGGPFAPSSITYKVENLGASTLAYEVTKTASWLTVTNASGSIPVSSFVNVQVSINANADLLGSGTHTDVVSFTNLTDHDGDTTRDVVLRVGTPELVYSFPLGSSPGWTTEGSWAYGQPTGGGGDHGYADPKSGHTGLNVYGYNLSGDYTNYMSERDLTTSAIDCSDLSGVTLKFWRRLGVEQPAYDHAYVRVSNDGTNFTTVWTNTEEITDSAWTQVEYDIADVADDQSTVYVRWTMGTTDASWTYCGWNIDDIEIWGIEEGATGVEDEIVAAGALLRNVPNPFEQGTAIQFRLPESGAFSLRVYDVAGRLVRVLDGGRAAAGPREVAWDGRDDAGTPVASGVYFARLETATRVESRRMVLLR